MTIKKIPGTVVEVRELTPTARDVVLELAEPMSFEAGAFVNLFVARGGAVVRRAFSISSSARDTRRITLSVRLTPGGAISPLFWEEGCVGSRVEVMGPLGLNTADKMRRSRAFLFGFGIGAGVVKALAQEMLSRGTMRELTICTGSRHEEEIVHKAYFDALAAAHPNVRVAYAVSAPQPRTPYLRGHIQEHLGGMDFNNTDVYVCGQEAACNELVEAIQKTAPQHCSFFVEGFH